MKVFYVITEDFGIYVFEALNIDCAHDHVDDVFPQLDLKKSDVLELTKRVTLVLEFNFIAIEKS